MNKQTTILVIDDDKEIRELFKWMLEASGFHVEFGINGITGIEKFREVQPDLIFLDVKMPDMDGFQALNEIRELDPNGKCPVLIISGFVDTSKIMDMMNNGASGFICKPFNINELQEKIQSSLGIQEAV